MASMSNRVEYNKSVQFSDESSPSVRNPRHEALRTAELVKMIAEKLQSAGDLIAASRVCKEWCRHIKETNHYKNCLLVHHFHCQRLPCYIPSIGALISKKPQSCFGQAAIQKLCEWAKRDANYENLRAWASFAKAIPSFAKQLARSVVAMRNNDSSKAVALFTLYSLGIEQNPTLAEVVYDTLKLPEDERSLGAVREKLHFSQSPRAVSAFTLNRAWAYLDEGRPAEEALGLIRGIANLDDQRTELLKFLKDDRLDAQFIHAQRQHFFSPADLLSYYDCLPSSSHQLQDQVLDAAEQADVAFGHYRAIICEKRILRGERDRASALIQNMPNGYEKKTLLVRLAETAPNPSLNGDVTTAINSVADLLRQQDIDTLQDLELVHVLLRALVQTFNRRDEIDAMLADPNTTAACRDELRKVLFGIALEHNRLGEACVLAEASEENKNRFGLLLRLARRLPQNRAQERIDQALSIGLALTLDDRDQIARAYYHIGDYRASFHWSRLGNGKLLPQLLDKYARTVLGYRSY